MWEIDDVIVNWRSSPVINSLLRQVSYFTKISVNDSLDNLGRLSAAIEASHCLIFPNPDLSRGDKKSDD